MSKIPFFAENFTTLTIPRTGDETCSPEDLVWAAITVGKNGMGDMIQYGSFSFSDIQFRIHLLAANLIVGSRGYTRSPLFMGLDSTEKGAVSYFIGMTMAKLFSWRYFGTPWMVHLQKLRAGRFVFLPGKSCPDLVGLDLSDQWIVVEAKGRTHAFSRPALERAKAQSDQIASIDGQLPVLRAAVEAYLYPSLSVALCDPDEISKNAANISISKSNFLRAYYQPIVNYIGKSKIRKSVGATYGYFCDTDILGVEIGLIGSVFEAFERQNIELFYDIGKVHKFEDSGFVLYPDGVLVRVKSDFVATSKR